MMKRLYGVLAAGTMFAVAGMAQEEIGFRFERAVPQIKLMGVQGSIMGKTVKGAPYSGLEVNESNQMLADGTRIHNETQTQVFRDSEGRMRRETGSDVTIWDPVANTSWALNTKERVARKLPMGLFVYTSSRGPGGETAAFKVSGSVRTTPDRKELKEEQDARIVEMEAKAARLKTEVETHVRMNGGGNVGFAVASGPTNIDVIQRRMVTHVKANSESLGKRTIEGVSAEGTRETATLEAGSIGNDRPIQTVTERWFSPELQVMMLTRSTDPRMGEEVSKLVNVNRSEPAAYLFQVPAGYQILESK